MSKVASSRAKRPSKQTIPPPPDSEVTKKSDSGVVPIATRSEPTSAETPEPDALAKHHHRIISSIDLEVAEYAEELRLALLQIAFDLRHLEGEELTRAVAYNTLECLRLASACASSVGTYKLFADDAAARASGVAA
jgi:hypothetical protein